MCDVFDVNNPNFNTNECIQTLQFISKPKQTEYLYSKS